MYYYFYVTKAYFMKKTVSLCIFWGNSFEEHLCSKMYFLREQLFESLWLLISLAAVLYFLSKFSRQVKALPVLMCINSSLKL